MIEIELDIFSGRPNPRWTLSPAEQREFLERVINGGVPMAPVSVSDGKLGYRGFVVHTTGTVAHTLKEKKLPTYFRVREGMTTKVDISSEQWLLASVEQLGLQEVVVEAAAEEIVAQPLVEEATALATCSYHVTSSTNFDFWNKESRHRLNNNCYNYCSNWRTNTFAQPGRGTGKIFTSLTVAAIKDAALRDGYKTTCSGGNLRVAFAIWPGVDYHWWRKTKSTSSGTARYCHKPGSTNARNKDNSGNYITSPYSCDRGKYTTWGGYLYGPGSSRQTVN
ncbi:hypothetical protein SAMN05421736_101487 [Evansella caseinilytica]|uniref:Uncharacterized protein n=1 Tax=Evansella caseinilytica TaxID=1503961 RepID=A0A1H3HGQ4_9BACI|nr:hypothetical protein [Evansella caseinilytica]SDY14405.1 hypothetical protein SAMN05421736_101487 [Evansella caseinilytica]